MSFNCPNSECKIMSFVRESGDYEDLFTIDTLHYKIDDNGVIDTVGKRAGPLTSVAFYLSTESDPELQTFDNDQLFGPGEIVVVTGYVKFMEEDEELSISLHSFDDAADTTPGNSASIQFRSTGVEIGLPHPIGIIASTEQAGPMWVGDDCPPNTSLGGLCRNNGGYAGFSPDLGTESFFGVAFNMGVAPQRVTYWGDWGEGYMQCNQYLNQNAEPFPGEPICTDVCEHPIHRLRINITGSGDEEAADEDGMQATLRGLAVGYATCEANPNYVNPIEDQV